MNPGVLGIYKMVIMYNDFMSVNPKVHLINMMISCPSIQINVSARQNVLCNSCFKVSVVKRTNGDHETLSGVTVNASEHPLTSLVLLPASMALPLEEHVLPNLALMPATCVRTKQGERFPYMALVGPPRLHRRGVASTI